MHATGMRLAPSNIASAFSGNTYKDLHQPAFVIGGCFALAAVVLSLFLILQHLRSYTNPAVSFSPFLSFSFFQTYTYFSYEFFAILAIMCMYSVSFYSDNCLKAQCIVLILMMFLAMTLSKGTSINGWMENGTITQYWVDFIFIFFRNKNGLLLFCSWFLSMPVSQ